MHETMFEIKGWKVVAEGDWNKPSCWLFQVGLPNNRQSSVSYLACFHHRGIIQVRKGDDQKLVLSGGGIELPVPPRVKPQQIYEGRTSKKEAFTIEDMLEVLYTIGFAPKNYKPKSRKIVIAKR